MSKHNLDEMRYMERIGYLTNLLDGKEFYQDDEITVVSHNGMVMGLPTVCLDVPTDVLDKIK